jgi:hypothetical protein
MRVGGRRAAALAAAAGTVVMGLFVPLGSAAPAEAGSLTVSPGALTFPDRPVGTRSDAEAVTVTNTGPVPVAISTFRITGPDAADFAQGAMCPVSPEALAPGASCTIYVSFSPDSAGPKSATLAVGDDAADSPQTVALSGVGSDSAGPPAASASPASLSFGSETLNTKSAAQAVTLSNTGAGPLTISTFHLDGPDAADFAQGADCPVSPDSLPAGGSCTIYVSFTPTSEGPKSATLVIGDNDSSGPQTVALSGTGILGAGEPTLSPASLTFADRTVGSTSDAQALTVTNSGPGPLAISTVHIEGPEAADFAQGTACPVSPDTLAAGASCEIYVSFTPHGGGVRMASLVIGDNAPSGTQSVPLSGTGLSAPQVALSTTALSFGSETLGTTSSAQTVTVTNTGGGPLSLGSVSIGAAAAEDFGAGGCPATLAAGASCSLSVTFAPTAEGARSASLTLTDDAADSPQSVSLFGSGVPAGTYLSDDFESGSLALWDRLTSSDSTIALDSSTAYAGTSSVRLTNNSGDQSSRLYANLAGGAHAQTYTRFCFRIAPGLTQGIEIANGRAITAEYPLGIRRWVITYNPVTQGLEGYFFNEALDRLDLYAANGLVSTGQWHCAEVYLDESVNGQAQLWLDGSLVGSVYGDLGTPSPYDRMYLWNQPSAGSVWFDDVRVASSPAGTTAGLPADP